MTGPISGQPGRGQERRDQAGRDTTGLSLASAPRYRRRRGQPPPRRSRRCRHRRPHAAPQAQDRRGKPRVDFSEPERQRGRHALAPLFDLADLGAQDFDVQWGPRGLDGTLGLAFRACSLFVLPAVFPSQVQARALLPVYVSRALTPEASLDLGSNFIELRFWEIRRPRRRWVCLTDAKQARRPRRGFLLRFPVATAVIRFE